jgi:hypothetical protein
VTGAVGSRGGAEAGTDAFRIDHTNLMAVAQGVSGIAASSFLLGDFVRFLHTECGVHNPLTLRAYADEVARFCERQHLPRPILPPVLRRALEREAADGGASSRRAPADPDFVFSFVSGRRPLVLRLAVAMAYQGTFRVGELLGDRVGVIRSRCLRRQDVAFDPGLEFARIVLRKGKSNVLNVDNTRVLVRPTVSAPGMIDPVRMLYDFMLTTRDRSDDHPLFVHEDGKIATTHQLRAAIQEHAHELHMPGLWGNHSLRRGANTRMRACDVSDADRRANGCWLSIAGDEPYRGANVQQAVRAQSALWLQDPAVPLRAVPMTRFVTASSPLLPGGVPAPAPDLR